MSFLDQRAEGRQIGLVQIDLGRMHVEVMALRLWSAMHGVVLCGGDEFQVLGIIPLQPFYELSTHASREVGILSVGLLPPAPARIPKDIDVRRPKRQALVTLVVIVTQRFLVLGARLVADCGRFFRHQL